MARNNPPPGGEVKAVLDFLMRKKLVILSLFLPLALAGTFWALYTPNLYRSTTSIFIEPQKVPQEYVRSTVTTDIETRVRTIVQTLTARTRLLKVMESIDLYPEKRKKGVSKDELLREMAKHLSVEIPNKKDDNFFRVSFTHENPQKAMAAVSQLVALFINESLEIREQQASGTTEFIGEQLQELKGTLERQEASIKSFRQNNMGELPQQLDANLRMLENLNNQLTNNLESQRELENRVDLLEEEVSRLSSGGFSSESDSLPYELVSERKKLLDEIARLESVYTDRHPDLVLARSKLAKLDEKIETARREQASTQEGKKEGIDTASPFYTEMTNARRLLTENRPRLAALREEERSIKEKISLYQKRVEIAPKREQELLSLTRDYENTKKNYEELLSKKLDAQLSENMEKRQKGERFRLLDPANLPETPVSPNRVKLIAIFIGGALGMGIGVALLMEIIHPVFFTLQDIRRATDFPLVIGIPHFQTAGGRRRTLLRWGIGLFALAAAAVVVLLLVDRLVIPLDHVLQTIRANIKEM